MSDEEIKVLRVLAASKATHGGVIDARLVVMAIDAMRTVVDAAIAWRRDESDLPAIPCRVSDELLRAIDGYLLPGGS